MRIGRRIIHKNNISMRQIGIDDSSLQWKERNNSIFLKIERSSDAMAMQFYHLSETKVVCVILP